MSSKFKDNEGYAAPQDSTRTCQSFEPEKDKEPQMRSGEMASTSHTTKSPSSALSATEETKQPISQSRLPTFAATAPVKKKLRRAGFREQFLQKVRDAVRYSHHIFPPT
jgi:hypothetical protein